MYNFFSIKPGHFFDEQIGQNSKNLVLFAEFVKFVANE